jgi:hypothetical protein
MHAGSPVHYPNSGYRIVTPVNFPRALRGFTRRQPFLPFGVELVSGDRLRVVHPEALSLRGELAMSIATDGSVRLFDSQSVSQLYDEPGQAPTPPTS